MVEDKDTRGGVLGFRLEFANWVDEYRDSMVTLGLHYFFVSASWDEAGVKPYSICCVCLIGGCVFFWWGRGVLDS